MNKKRILQFIVVIFIYIAGVFVYAYVSYQSSKKEEIAKTDEALFGVVSTADLFLKPYHNHTLNKTSIDEADFGQICDTLNKEIQCTPLGEISLKGFDLPIKTYMVDGCIKKRQIN